MKSHTISKAKDFSYSAHQGQFRKDGKPYFTHVEAVAKIVDEEWDSFFKDSNSHRIWNPYKDNAVAAAYLHDVMEDCGVTRQDLIAVDIPEMVVDIVDALTKKEGETYFDFIMRIWSDNLWRQCTIAVKLADLKHNMSDLKEGSLKDKYRFAAHILRS